MFLTGGSYSSNMTNILKEDGAWDVSSSNYLNQHYPSLMVSHYQEETIAPSQEPPFIDFLGVGAL